MHRHPISVAVILTCHALRTRGEDFQVFDAGVMLWELVTGRSYDFATARYASDLREDCPAAVDDIVSIATALDPLIRFRTRDEMAWTLESALAPELDIAIAPVTAGRSRWGHLASLPASSTASR